MTPWISSSYKMGSPHGDTVCNADANKKTSPSEDSFYGSTVNMDIYRLYIFHSTMFLLLLFLFHRLFSNLYSFQSSIFDS